MIDVLPVPLHANDSEFLRRYARWPMEQSLSLAGFHHVEYALRPYAESLPEGPARTELENTANACRALLEQARSERRGIPKALTDEELLS